MIMIYKDVTIKGLEGLYKISDKGDLYSRRKNKKLKPANNSSGYLMHYLTPDKGQGYWMMKHRIVLITFKGNKEGYEVNHIDEDKHNNALYNLEWVTHIDNVKKSYEDGQRKLNRECEWRIRAIATPAARAKMAKKKNKAILVIDSRTGGKTAIESINQAATRYSLNRRTIYRYIKGISNHKYLLFSFAE